MLSEGPRPRPRAAQHNGTVEEPIVLQRRFRLWLYTVGDSEMLLHGRADAKGEEHLNVLFEDVDAVKLRLSYRPLVLQRADDDTRADILSFAGVPARFQAERLCLILPIPDTEPGFIVCGRATVLAHPDDGTYGLHRLALKRTEHTRVLHSLTQRHPQ
jgi:hypothetical protein